MRITFTESIRQYWKYLVGVAVFPTMAFLGDYYGIPDGVIVTVFVVVMLSAGYPYWFKDAPFAFGGAMIVTWILGIAAAAALMTLLRLVSS